jgi:hypothetical protein
MSISGAQTAGYRRAEVSSTSFPPLEQRPSSYNIVSWLQTLFFSLKHCFICKKHNLDGSNIVWALQTLFWRLKHCFLGKNNV